MSFTPVSINFVSATDLIQPVPTPYLLLREEGSFIKNRSIEAEDAGKPGGLPQTARVASYQVAPQGMLNLEMRRIGASDSFRGQVGAPAALKDTETGVIGQVHYDPATRLQVVKINGAWQPVNGYLGTIWRWEIDRTTKIGAWVRTSREELFAPLPDKAAKK